MTLVQIMRVIPLWEEIANADGSEHDTWSILSNKHLCLVVTRVRGINGYIPSPKGNAPGYRKGQYLSNKVSVSLRAAFGGLSFFIVLVAGRGCVRPETNTIKEK